MKQKILILLTGLVLALSCNHPKCEKNLGIGVYPGAPSQNYSPILVGGGSSYRNLALMRAATHSSSFDYNQTAQLLTDGLISETPAVWFEVLKDGQALSCIEQTYLTDMNHTTVSLKAGEVLELSFHGYQPEADKLILAIAEGDLEKVRVKVEGLRADGIWASAGEASGNASKGQKGENKLIFHDWEFSVPMEDSFGAYRFCFDATVSLREVFFYKDGRVQDALPSQFFTSSWKSATASDEWVCIDLGAVSRFDKMCFHWINAPRKAVVQCSENGTSWKEIATFEGAARECSFPYAKGRYVRLSLSGTDNGEPFELSEWEVYGKGGMTAVPKPAPKREGRRQMLSGGNWQLCRDGDTAHWLPATVPGTVLGTFIDNGAVLHPNYADNQFYISDSYFRSDFWYRNTFEARTQGSEYQSLHFEGINYQAEVFLNETPLGLIDGAFRSADFNVTGILRDGTNLLSVKILHNPSYGQVKQQTAYTPDSNGGVLGADNPTMHATIGWDWIPTVRGRNIGIYDDVWLAFTGPVTVEEPFVRAELPLPDTTSATVMAQATLVNHAPHPVKGLLKWSFGQEKTTLPVELLPGERRQVKLEPLLLQNPRLWWPNGYGEQYQYPVRFSFELNGLESDAKEFLLGVRTVS